MTILGTHVAAELRLTRRFQKSFEKLDKVLREKVSLAVGELADNPRLGKPLKGPLEDEWSLRVGDYRVLYSIDRNIVWVETVRHRREAYR